MAENIRIPVHYVKSASFRVAHADGAYGGPTPQGFINMAFYSERIALPRDTELEIAEGGVLVDEHDIERRKGTVREFEFAVTMDLKTAASLRDWLDRKVDELQKILAEANG